MHRTRIAAALVLAASVLASVCCGAEPESRVDFNRDIRPILSDKCFHCHGPDAEHRQAELRLDEEDSAKADRGGYRAIAAGEPAESELVARITDEDEYVRMPPPDSGKTLSQEEIELLCRWIAQGAEWSPHWAYVSPRRHPVPKVSGKHADWPLNWIDQFIVDRLNQEGLSPSPDADRVTLIRRLSFDLTGLPPTPEEVDQFAASNHPNAYEQLVDRLLASDRFGERMAIYWLDLVRYADTVGYHGDQGHHASPYRDYVIDAFNENLPFDQFTREQLAGDLLPDPTIDQQVASGYNRLLQTSHEGGVQPKEYLAIYAADRIRNVSAVWMAATLGCSQCHDHKYDPLTSKDFYSLQAFFADLDEAHHLSHGDNKEVTTRAPEIKVLTRHERREVARLDEQLERLRAQLTGAAAEEDGDTETLQRQIDEATKLRQQIEDSARLMMVSAAIEPRTIRILPRGNWLDDSGPIVQPEVPAALGDLEVGERRANRLDLADWLTDSENGAGLLTARVMANRFWYLLMGEGIAKDLDDFGGQGEPPVHPELLDRLAIEFAESGWSVKHMMKLIAMSRTYRQSSLAPPKLRERDPYNRLYARQARFRLPAEMVRDNALAISGLLVLDYGGGSVRPYQPAGYYRHLNFPTRQYQQHNDDRQWRRGVYVHWQRQFLHPMLKAFDAPSREECTAQRPRSNTPIAAMTLLNDPTFVEAARVFAARIMREGGESDAQRIEFAFRWATSRQPEENEAAVLRNLFEANLSHYRSQTDEAKQLASVGLAPASDDLDPIELAAWTSLARALLCANETLTRN